MIYEYIIDNNETYEDQSDVTILTTEEIPFEEFQQIVRKAYDLCGNFNGYHHIAKKIVEIDSRFFFPKTKAYAFVGMEIEDYENKVRGFHEVK